MSHLTVRSAYRDLADRINRFPQGAPPSDVLFAILKLLFSEREAGLVALLPIRPFTVEDAARRWKMPEAEARRVLDALADRAILLDTEHPDGRRTYVLPPPMAGFFEFSMMRVRNDVDQKLLAELFYQYLNVEEDFIRDLFGRRGDAARTGLRPRGRGAGRTVAARARLRARERGRPDGADIGVGICYCRHKMQHVGRACDAPLDICMTFNAAAASLVRHGVARRVDAAEGLDLLQQAATGASCSSARTCASACRSSATAAAAAARR